MRGLQSMLCISPISASTVTDMGSSMRKIPMKRSNRCCVGSRTLLQHPRTSREQRNSMAFTMQEQTPMINVFVTYPGTASTRFDREYYAEKHLPLVDRVWGPHGLESTAAFFPCR